MAMWIEPSIAEVSLYDSSIRASGNASQDRGSPASGPLHRTQPTAPVNPYHVLQLRRDATPSEIRQSYRRLALFHHCGRTGTARTELQRRWQVFVIVAACYETLIDKDSRCRMDLLLKDRETGRLTAGLPTGAMYVGGQKVFERMNMSSTQLDVRRSLFDKVSLVDGEDHDRLPPGLASVSSASFSDDSIDGVDGDDDDCTNKSGIGVSIGNAGNSHGSANTGQPNLLSMGVFGCGADMAQPDDLAALVAPSSTSKDSRVPEVHFTERETNRLFGGPLSLMMQARRWKPFTDPFVLFEQVFGSQIFPVPLRDELPALDWVPIQKSTARGWHGSARTEKDGITVFVTTRVLHNRRLTKTERVTKDALGHQTALVSVTSEDIEPPESMEETANCDPCLMCPSPPEPFSDGPHDTIAAHGPMAPQYVEDSSTAGDNEASMCHHFGYLCSQIRGDCGSSSGGSADHSDFDLYHHLSAIWGVRLFPK